MLAPGVNGIRRSLPCGPSSGAMHCIASSPNGLVYHVSGRPISPKGLGYAWAKNEYKPRGAGKAPPGQLIPPLSNRHDLRIFHRYLPQSLLLP